jgi:hypothetical protein
MTMRVNSPHVVCCAAVAIWLCCAASLRGQSIAPPRIVNEPPAEPFAVAQLPTLQRVLRTFDFEEAEAFNLAFPQHFYRLSAPDLGFPPFGHMRFSNAMAARGRWSFEFELAGGSMSARIPTGVLPVLPYADYLVTAKVRTSGLVHARARVVCWLVNDAGELLESSRGQSKLSAAEERWDTLTVELRGESANAAHLIIELQALQPRQFQTSAAQSGVPNVEDISGRVWFDDVIVSHLPRLNLSMAQPSNMAVLPDRPRLTMVLSELSSELLTAHLRVFDLDARIVHEDSFPAPRGRQHANVDLPLARCGWYRAVLDINSRDRLARRQVLDFLVLAEQDRHELARPSHITVRPAPRLAVILPPTPPDGLALLPLMVERLGVREAVLAVWSPDLTIQTAQQRLSSLRSAIEQMIRRQVDLTFSLDRMPDELARALALDPPDVFKMLEGDSRTWRPYLDELLVNFGLEVSDWQIGDPREPAIVPPDQLPSAVDAAARSLADFVPQPGIIVPWPAEQSLDGISEAHAQSVSILVPHHISPASVGDYARHWAPTEDQPDADTRVTLDQLPAGDHSIRQRVTDLMLRGLFAWRAGVRHVAIEAPWRYDSQQPGQSMPDASFAIWRTLAQELDGRQYAGELPVTDGVHCWFLRSDSGRDSALIAWTDQAIGSQPASLRLQLAMGPVRVMDAFGNVEHVAPQDSTHVIPLGELPVIIRDVALELVQFRGSFAIDPDFVPAAARVHEHAIVLRNPWSVAVSGTVRLINDEQWQLIPTVQNFVMPAGGEARLPLSIIPQRNITAGRKTILADVTLNADRSYDFRAESHVDVGLKNIDLAASWSAVPNPETGGCDLVITNVVTNKGEQMMNLDVYLLAAGVSQNRRTIARLGPGETAVRTFRIPDGAVLLADKSVRVGVEERDGVARLNRVLEITGLNESSLRAAVGQ